MVPSFVKATAFNTLHTLGIHHRLRNRKLNTGQVTVLCLHKVSDEKDHFWEPIRPESFELLVQYLVQHYDIITVSDIDRPSDTGRPRVILSFDDGYYDFYTNVLPVLRRYSIPANHNIVSAIADGTQQMIWTERLNFLFNYFLEHRIQARLEVGQSEISLQGAGTLGQSYIICLKELFKLNPAARIGVLDGWFRRFSVDMPVPRMMGWEEIRVCARHGVEIGSHTMTHPILTSVADPQTLVAELAGSKAALEENLGIPINILAPPNGIYDARVLGTAAQVGYKYLLGIGESSGRERQVDGVTVLSRLNMISEPYTHMVLRIEEVVHQLKRLIRR